VRVCACVRERECVVQVRPQVRRYNSTRVQAADAVHARLQQHAQGRDGGDLNSTTRDAPRGRVAAAEKLKKVRKHASAGRDTGKGTGEAMQQRDRRSQCRTRVGRLPPSLRCKWDSKHSGVLQRGTSAALLYSDGPPAPREVAQRDGMPWLADQPPSLGVLCTRGGGGEGGEGRLSRQSVPRWKGCFSRGPPPLSTQKYTMFCAC
jgi:hypothetical protein